MDTKTKKAIKVAITLMTAEATKYDVGGDTKMYFQTMKQIELLEDLIK